MRGKVHVVAIGMSVLFVIDNIFMAWAYLQGGNAGMIYAFCSLLPIFCPATLASFVLTGIYVRGFKAHSWKLQRTDRTFFLIFAVSLSIKVVLSVFGVEIK